MGTMTRREIRRELTLVPKGFDRDLELEERIDSYADGDVVSYFDRPENQPCADHDHHPHFVDGVLVYLVRRRRGLSRAQLVEKVLGLSLCSVTYESVWPGQREAILTVGDIRDFEHERREPPFGLAGAIAFALGVRLSSLVACRARLVREPCGWRVVRSAEDVGAATVRE